MKAGSERVILMVSEDLSLRICIIQREQLRMALATVLEDTFSSQVPFK